MRREIILLIICLFLGQTLVQARETDELDFAQKLYQDRMYELAAEQLRRFLRDWPADPKAPAAQLLLAHCYLKAEKFEEALHSYQDFIVNYPEDIHLPEAWKGYAQSLALLNRPPKAAEAYLKLQGLFPGSHLAPRALLEAGKIFYEAGQPLKAIQALRLLITEYKDSPLTDEAHYWLGISNRKAGNYTGALSELSKVSSAVWRPRALLETTRIRLEQNNLTEAERIFLRSKKEFPQNPATAQAAVLLADKLREKGQFSQALGFLRQAIGILPEGKLKEKAVLDLADSHLKAGEDSLAILWYQSFLKAFPRSPRRPEAIFGLERAYVSQNKLESALRNFRMLQALVPNSRYVKSSYQLLALAYLRNGRAAEAAGFYTEYLSLCDQKEEAERVKFELAGIYQKNLRWLNRAILLYQELAQGASAIAESSQFALARCLEQQGEPARAREEYQLLLQRFPTGQFAAEARQRLQYIQQFSPDWRRATKRLFQILKDGLTEGSEEQSLYSLALACYRELKDFEEAASVLKAYVEKYPESTHADTAQYLLAQCYLKLQQKCSLNGQARAAEEFHQKAAEAYQVLTKNYPESSWADDAAIFLIENTLSDAHSDSARWGLLLDSYQQFLETYLESDRLDFALLRIGDAYRGLSSEDASLAQRAISIYQKLEEQFPHSLYADDARFGIGICQKRTGDLKAAESSFRSLLSRYPGSQLAGRARFQLGRLLFLQGKFQEAAGEFGTLLTQSLPTDQPLQLIRLYLAEAYSQIGQADKASVLYQEILKQIGEADQTPAFSSDNLEKQTVKRALLGLASIYEKEGKYAEAVSLYNQHLRLFPQDSASDSVLFFKGKLLLSLGKKSEAVGVFRQLTEKFSSSLFAPEAAERIGSILFSQRKYKDALSAYGLAVSLDQQRMEAAGGMAICLLRTGQRKQAARALRSFKKRFGRLPAAKQWLARFEYERGLLWLEQKAYKRARGQFQRVLEKFPESEFADDASYYIALCLLQEGKKNEAIQALIHFCENFPSSAYIDQVNMRLGGLYYLERQFANAADAYQKVLADTTGDLCPDAMFNLILAYERLGQLGLAMETAEKLVDRFPDYESIPRVKVKIGVFLMELEKYEKAIEQFNHCLRWSTGEQEAEIRFYIAECYFNLAEYQKSLYWYLRVVYLNPEQQMWAVTAQYKAGQACERLNKFDQAKSLYGRIIARYGVSSEWGRAARERLKKLENRREE